MTDAKPDVLGALSLMLLKAQGGTALTVRAKSSPDLHAHLSAQRDADRRRGQVCIHPDARMGPDRKCTLCGATTGRDCGRFVYIALDALSIVQNLHRRGIIEAEGE